MDVAEEARKTGSTKILKDKRTDPQKVRDMRKQGMSLSEIEMAMKGKLTRAQVETAVNDSSYV